MAAFANGHKKLGGRKQGTGNKGTESIKALLNTLLPEDELAKLWNKKLRSKNEHIAMKAFELALHYMFGKPVQSHRRHTTLLLPPRPLPGLRQALLDFLGNQGISAHTPQHHFGTVSLR